jgi:hypothetical protein
MPERTTKVGRAEAEPDEQGRDYDRYASYEDGDATVICDRKNPNAWLKSTAATELRR